MEIGTLNWIEIDNNTLFAGLILATALLNIAILTFLLKMLAENSIFQKVKGYFQIITVSVSLALVIPIISLYIIGYARRAIFNNLPENNGYALILGFSFLMMIVLDFVISVYVLIRGRNELS